MRDADMAEWLKQYDTCNTGPRPDQRGAYHWFKQQGNKSWPRKWPLHKAAMEGNVAAIRNLTTTGGIDPNVKMTDWFDSEPLGWAASFGELKAVIALIETGADPLRPPNKAGNTPRADAVRERHDRVVRFLDEYEKRLKNANVNSNLPNLSPKKKKHADKGVLNTSMAEWLKQYDTSNTGPRPGSCARAQEWFRSNGGWTHKWPLHKAAMEGDVPEIRRLTTTGGLDPNLKMTDWFDSEPLGWAASLGQLKAVIALIEAGADPLRPPNKSGNTPRSDAQRELHDRVIGFLDEYESRLEAHMDACLVGRGWCMATELSTLSCLDKRTAIIKGLANAGLGSGAQLDRLPDCELVDLIS